MHYPMKTIRYSGHHTTVTRVTQLSKKGLLLHCDHHAVVDNYYGTQPPANPQHCCNRLETYFSLQQPITLHYYILGSDGGIVDALSCTLLHCRFRSLAPVVYAEPIHIFAVVTLHGQGSSWPQAIYYQKTN